MATIEMPRTYTSSIIGTSPEIVEWEGNLIVSGIISIMSGADSARLPIVTPRTPNSAGVGRTHAHISVFLSVQDLRLFVIAGPDRHTVPCRGVHPCLSVCVRPPIICHRGFRSAHCALPRGALDEDLQLMRAIRSTRFSLCVMQGASASGWHPDWRMCSSY